MAKPQERIVELQRALKVARDALEKITNGCRDPERTAGDALYRMWPLEQKQPLQKLVGHERP